MIVINNEGSQVLALRDGDLPVIIILTAEDTGAMIR
jgi:hypothetical protein